jgi:hypothetical protein
VSGVQLLNVGFGNVLLLIVGVEDGVYLLLHILVILEFQLVLLFGV